MRVQQVVMPDGAESWTVLDDTGDPVGPVEAFLAHLQALDRSPTTVRAYAFSLKWWFEFLGLVGVGWDEVKAEHAVAAELAARAARDLPRADRLADLLYKQSSQLPDFDPAELQESDWLEGCLLIEAVEPDALFFGGGIGPVATCDEAARLAEPGWVVNVVLARIEGSWRVVEVGNVSLAWG